MGEGDGDGGGGGDILVPTHGARVFHGAYGTNKPTEDRW